VEFEWDPRKNRANIRKHGIDFQDAVEVFEKLYLEGLDPRYDYGEERVIAYGQMGPHIVVVVFVQRAGRRRILSARKATKAEAKACLEALYGKGQAGED
jgi:uncharacterized protein